MAPTYLEEGATAEEISKGDEEAQQQKVSLNSNEEELRSEMIPPHIRAAYASKIWALLAFQMSMSFLVSLAVEASVERPDDKAHGVYMWIASSVIAFISLALLRCVRQTPGLNYAMFFVVIICTGVFWGLMKFIVRDFFNLNATGITTLSLVFSAMLNCLGITDKLGDKLKPKGGAARPFWSKDKNSGSMRMSSKVQPELKKSKSKLQQASATIKSDITQQNDGVMRATMLLGIVTWLISSIVCLVITVVLMQMYEKGKAVNMTRHASMGSAVAGVLLAFFMCIFFHYGCERHMRKCNMDEWFKPIIEINSDIVIVFIILYAIVIILACNDQSLEMRADGAGGDMDAAGADGGDADMGFEGDAGAERAGDPAGMDHIIGGQGV